MITAMVGGKLWTDPEQRTGQSGKRYTMAKLVTHDGGDAGSTFVSVFAFGETVQGVLLSLGKGAAVTVTGSLKLSVWTDQQGVAHPQATLSAEAILTLHEKSSVDRAVAVARRPREEATPSQPPQRPARRDVDRSRQETASMWQGRPDASGFDSMESDQP